MTIRQYKEDCHILGTTDHIVIELEDTEVWLTIKTMKDAISVSIGEREMETLVKMLTRIKSIR